MFRVHHLFSTLPAVDRSYAAGVPAFSYLLSSFSVTPLLWGGVPAPLSPAVRPLLVQRAPLPP